MIVPMALYLQNVLIGGEGISIVHIAQLVNELIHDAVVPELLLVDHVCALLNDSIITHAVRKLELVIILELFEPDALLFDEIGIVNCLFCALLAGILFLILDFLHGFPKLIMAEMSIETPCHKALSLTSFCELVVAELFKRVLELLALDLLLDRYCTPQSRSTPPAVHPVRDTG